MTTAEKCCRQCDNARHMGVPMLCDELAGEELATCVHCFVTTPVECWDVLGANDALWDGDDVTDSDGVSKGFCPVCNNPGPLVAVGGQKVLLDEDAR